MSFYNKSGIKNILVTGGAGFIGGSLIRKLLKTTNINIFNLDKLGYASDLTGINQLINDEKINLTRYKFFQINLINYEEIKKAVFEIDPDLVFHLAAESHVDRSINGPRTFLESNVIGTFNLLESLKSHWESLSWERKNVFKYIHISTDEVFGSLGEQGLFTETSPYDPRSPYSASKAASDHLVNSFHHTYGFPSIITNCSNNYGPWQFPEKFIPLSILNSSLKKNFKIYGDGENIRDWIFVEDHISALELVALHGEIGSTYCIGGEQQKTNNEIVDLLCSKLDKYNELNKPHCRFKEYVKDRLGHDRRYAISNKKIKEELNWFPKYSLEDGLDLTIKWYLDNLNWCKKVAKDIINI